MIQVKSWSLATLAVLSVLVSVHAHASITYNYTGNPFTSASAGVSGDWITASVTFSDPLITSSFTGTVGGASVSSWSIGVEQISGSELNNTNAQNSVSYLSFPLWFHFESGTITSWQLLGAVNQGYPEIYTTNASPYGSIVSTSDFYNSAPGIYGVNYSQPGTWSVVSTPIPAAVWLFGSALFGLRFIGTGRSMRKQSLPL